MGHSTGCRQQRAISAKDDNKTGLALCDFLTLNHLASF